MLGTSIGCSTSSPGGVSFRFLRTTNVEGSARSSLSLSALPESEFVTALIPPFTTLLLELWELIGTLDSVVVEENEVVADRVAASCFSCGEGGGIRGGISTACISLCVAVGELIWMVASSAAPLKCCAPDRFFVGERFFGVDALLKFAELFRELLDLVGEAVGSRELRLLLLALEGLGEATMISSSIMSFLGIRFFGIVNGLKKSLMDWLLAAGGMVAVRNASRTISAGPKFHMQEGTRVDAKNRARIHGKKRVKTLRLARFAEHTTK